MKTVFLWLPLVWLWPAALADAGPVFTGPAVLTTSSFPTGIVVPFPGGQPAVVDTAKGFTFTGDLTVDVTIAGEQWSALWQVRRPFRVGMFPELADSRLAVDLKLANGLGTADSPLSQVLTVAEVYLAGNSEQSWLVMQQTWLQTGNGITYANGLYTAGPLVLSPDRDYELCLSNHLWMRNPSYLPATVTLEFGGVSAFGGIDLQLVTVPVPEPALAGLLLSALPVLRRRPPLGACPTAPG